MVTPDAASVKSEVSTTDVKTTKYVVITPVRDEAEHVLETIKSVAGQTVRPLEWVIVNDGSTDDTGAILDRQAQEHPWMHVVHRANRGFRKSGGGVVEAFYDGYNVLRTSDWDFVVKLDGDLTFAPDYFEKCFLHFQQNPKLGIAGGDIYHDISGAMKLERNPQFHVRGATKIYRRPCWEAIGGLWPAPGWDTIDEVKANMLGWQTYTLPELKLHHHRITGMADGLVRDRIKQGKVCYIAGYHPLFVLARFFARLGHKPRIVGSCALLYGYMQAIWKRQARVDDKRYIGYIRAQQMRRLLGMQTIWK